VTFATLLGKLHLMLAFLETLTLFWGVFIETVRAADAF
jgi:hypothetical protein